MSKRREWWLVVRRRDERVLDGYTTEKDAQEDVLTWRWPRFVKIVRVVECPPKRKGKAK